MSSVNILSHIIFHYVDSLRKHYVGNLVLAYSVRVISNILTLITVQFCKEILGIGRLCGLVPEFLATDPEAWVRFPALPKKKVVGLERGPLCLVSTTEEVLDKKVAAPV
jgi:hypothetical protein